MKRVKQFFKYLAWLEQERINAAIYTCSAGPLM